MSIPQSVAPAHAHPTCPAVEHHHCNLAVRHHAELHGPPQQPVLAAAEHRLVGRVWRGQGRAGQGRVRCSRWRQRRLRARQHSRARTSRSLLSAIRSILTPRGSTAAQERVGWGEQRVAAAAAVAGGRCQGARRDPSAVSLTGAVASVPQSTSSRRQGRAQGLGLGWDGARGDAHRPSAAAGRSARR